MNGTPDHRQGPDFKIDDRVVSFAVEMKRVFFFVLLAWLLFQCKSEEKTNQDGLLGVTEYGRLLDTLSIEESSNLYAIDIFEDRFDMDNAGRCDSAFYLFLQFQDSLIGQLNERLFASADYDKINSLAWADTSAHLPEGKNFRKSLTRNGLQLLASEGMVFITRKVDPLEDAFYPRLTDAGQDFFTQFAHEAGHPFSEDAAMLIPVRSLADRVAFWEAFTENHPDHIFTPYAQQQAENYRYFLLVGLNNTPAFDYDLQKIDREFLNAYLYFVKKYPNAKSAGILKDYLGLLEKTDFKRNDEIDRFVEQYNIFGSR